MHASLPFTVLKLKNLRIITWDSVVVVHASLPFTVLKQCNLFSIVINLSFVVHASLPFTVLKQTLSEITNRFAARRACLLTVYGFETTSFQIFILIHL